MLSFQYILLKNIIWTFMSETIFLIITWIIFEFIKLIKWHQKSIILIFFLEELKKYYLARSRMMRAGYKWSPTYMNNPPTWNYN
jgi:hypothetical protein